MTFVEALKFKSLFNYTNNEQGIRMRLYIVPSNISFPLYFNKFLLKDNLRETVENNDDYLVYGMWNIGTEVFYKQMYPEEIGFNHLFPMDI